MPLKLTKRSFAVLLASISLLSHAEQAQQPSADDNKHNKPSQAAKQQATEDKQTAAPAQLINEATKPKAAPAQAAPQPSAAEVDSQMAGKATSQAKPETDSQAATKVTDEAKLGTGSKAATKATGEAKPEVEQLSVQRLCTDIGKKLGSVSIAECEKQALVASGYFTPKGYPLAMRHYGPLPNRTPQGRIILMGGIHGDEYASVSVLFKWMNKLNRYHSGLFNWQVIPLANPDGLLQRKSKRQNANGVDLNRNFPTPDWDEKALQYWQQRTFKNVRRYPGPKAASEVETKWLLKVIEEFQPDAIISVHAPHKLIDFDGPQNPPQQLGKLQLRRLGTYPGSLGNYGGSVLDVPILTVELPFAGIMPSNAEISKMWTDLVGWLIKEIPKQKEKRLAKAAIEEPPSGGTE
ncbi:MAG: M14 family murein peptide amidase A [Cellvibrionaceae bacterium]|nr:M14 family murein peptide amidase A [Cellvibrionaceae bacterium]